MALRGPDQQPGYAQGGYQTNMATDMSGQKGQQVANPQLAHQPVNDLGKDGQQGHGGWPSSVEQPYYKAGVPGPSHPGNYYGSHMAPSHNPYMWAGQQMIPPYGSGPQSHYGYGAMYGQHPTMTTQHQTAAYGYNSPAQGQGKDGMMVPTLPAQANQNLPAAVSAPGAREQGTTDNSSEEDIPRSKRGYDSLAVTDVGVQMATPIGTNPPSQYPYSSEMWAMGAPVQRGATNPPMAGDVATMQFQVQPDEREIKRQRRKQSNRESARRSRLRKQAECEDLGLKVNSVSVENSALKKKLSELQERCTALTDQNKRLREQALSAGLPVDPPVEELLPTQIKPESAEMESALKAEEEAGSVAMTEADEKTEDEIASDVGKLIEISQAAEVAEEAKE